MTEAELISRMDALLEGPVYLLDCFPVTVPPKPDGRYFEIEALLRRGGRGEIGRRFTRLLLKLYCYCDFWVSARPPAQELMENPAPSRLAGLLRRCFAGRRRAGGAIRILLPEHDCMITLSGEDLYMAVYHPSERLKRLFSALAQSEGLFFRAAPKGS